jgi:hypothetical protein
VTFRKVAKFSIILLLVVWFFYPTALTGHRLGNADWDVLTGFSLAFYSSVVKQHALPLWNPWECGGNVLLGNPQVPAVNFLYLFGYFFSVPVAWKLTLATFYLLGFLGAIRLAQKTIARSDFFASLLFGVMFVFSGVHAIHLRVGHTVFLPFLLTPLWLSALIGLTKHRVQRADILLSAGLGAFYILYGAFHAYIMTGVIFAMFFITLKIIRYGEIHVWRLLTSQVIALLIAAPKLAALLEFKASKYYFDNRDYLTKPDKNSFQAIWRSFTDFSLNLNQRIPDQSFWWHEFSAYMGYPSVIIIVGGIVLGCYAQISRKRANKFFISSSVALVMAVLLVAGTFAPYSPYNLLRSLPVISTLRVASRYTYFVVIFAPFTALLGYRMICRWQKTPKIFTQIVSSLFLLIICIDMGQKNSHQLAAGFYSDEITKTLRDLPILTNHPTLDTRTEAFAPGSPMVQAIYDSRSLLNCYEPISIRTNAATDTYRQSLADIQHYAINQYISSPSPETSAHFNNISTGNFIELWQAHRNTDGYYEFYIASRIFYLSLLLSAVGIMLMSWWGLRASSIS